MSKSIKKQVTEIIEKLQEEGYPINLIDCSKEDEEVWVAYVFNQNPTQIAELKKYTADTGKLLEPTMDLLEPLEELYTSLKSIYKRENNKYE